MGSGKWVGGVRMLLTQDVLNETHDGLSLRQSVLGEDNQLTYPIWMKMVALFLQDQGWDVHLYVGSIRMKYKENGHSGYQYCNRTQSCLAGLPWGVSDGFAIWPSFAAFDDHMVQSLPSAELIYSNWNKTTSGVGLNPRGKIVNDAKLFSQKLISVLERQELNQQTLGRIESGVINRL